MSEDPKPGKTGQMILMLDTGAIAKALVIAAVSGFVMLVFNMYQMVIQHETRLDNIEKVQDRWHMQNS